MTLPTLYTELPSWWPLLSRPQDYAEEAAIFTRVIQAALRYASSAGAAPTLLESGSGGGNNASHMKAKILLGILLLFCFVFYSAIPSSLAAADLAIYTDALASGWQDWSWDANVNRSSTSPVYSGSQAIAVQFTAAWGGLYLHSSGGVDLANYDRLRFWIHGGSAGGQHLRVVTNDIQPGVAVSATAGQWTQVVIQFSDLGSPGILSDLYWQETSGGPQPVFFIDQVELLERSGTVTPEPGPALSVNAAAERKPISPYIYGMNFASTGLADELDLPVNRRGGNSTSRYN